MSICNCHKCQACVDAIGERLRVNWHTKLRELKDDLLLVWAAFERGQRVLGCKGKEEFATTILRVDIRTVQYLLNGRPKPKQANIVRPAAPALTPKQLKRLKDSAALVGELASTYAAGRDTTEVVNALSNIAMDSEELTQLEQAFCGNPELPPLIEIRNEMKRLSEALFAHNLPAFAEVAERLSERIDDRIVLNQRIADSDKERQQCGTDAVNAVIKDVRRDRRFQDDMRHILQGGGTHYRGLKIMNGPKFSDLFIYRFNRYEVIAEIEESAGLGDIQQDKLGTNPEVELRRELRELELQEAAGD